jgi:type VI secretion system protein ImpC
MSAEQQAAAQGAAATTQEADSAYESLLDNFTRTTRTETTQEAERMRGAFDEFLGQLVKPNQVLSRDVESTIKYWIGEIDKKLSDQLNDVMHHPDFQRLEGSWRGLHYLVHESETSEFLKIRVLNVTKRELFKDLERAVEFDQSTLFKKVYEEEYNQLGGQPFGMLLGDYEFGRTPEDVSLMKMISGVAATAHAPFVAAASPKMFRLESYTDLPTPRDLAKIFSTVDYAAWNSFRETEDSRYVALTLPRVLSRLPYGRDFKTVDEFNFEESVDGQDHSKYLWMNAAWAYGARVTAAFAVDGWFGRTRGVEGGGKVEGLPVHTFATDEGGVAMKCPTEVLISDSRELELSTLGFLPLLHCKNRDFAAFLGAQTCQKPKKFYQDAATANADLSTKLNFMLCVSRFAHYLKVMARDKIGSYMDVHNCQRWLNDWIANYVCDPTIAGEEMKAKRPLADARIDVEEVPGRPGWYQAVAYLRPHLQLEGINASMRLVASVPPRAGG